MRDIVCLVLASLILSTTTLDAKTGAVGAVPTGQVGAERKLTLKEQILEVPPGTMIEVRLLNKQKIRGRLGDPTNEGFSLKTAHGDKIETQTVSFTDLKSFKKVEVSKAAKTATWIVVGALAGLAVVVTVILVMMAHGG